MEQRTFDAARRRALQVRRQYAAWEERRYGRAWTAEEVALGLVGDVGDLAKLILAESGVRAIPEARDKLAHELADCLWSLLVLADLHGVDLEQSFFGTMDVLERYLSGGGDAG